MKTLRLCFLISALLLTGCMLLTPEDPPQEPTELKPDDFAWDEIDIAQDYEYIDVTRIDCGTLRSKLTGSGKCLSVKLPFATSAIRCPLSFPAESLTFACIDQDQVPALYVSFAFSKNAHNIDLSELMPCAPASDGPAAQKPPRFPTDPGYHVCLLQNATPGELVQAPDALRPAGTYIDLSNTACTDADIQHLLNNHILSGPFDIVMDTRFLDEQARTKAFKDLPALFRFYRKLPVHPNLNTAPNTDSIR